MTPTVGSHALLLQLSTNLVHNAIVHILPEDGTVWVTTGVQPESAVLSVENTGEKLSPRLVSTLVDSIIRAHDGTLAVAPRAAGGLRVTVQLPAAPPLQPPDPEAADG